MIKYGQQRQKSNRKGGLMSADMWILFVAALYGATMKLADLFDEHGMHWFAGDKIVFGFLWGIFGALLVLSRVDIANFILAMVLAFIVRMRIDYRNHAIATAIIILAFVWKSQFDAIVFFVFFASFVIFGMLRDYLGDARQRHDWLYFINEPAWYYVIPPLVYAVFTGDWLLFWISTTSIVLYDLIKYGFFYSGRYAKL
jgi:hypothetical protein